MLPEIKIGQHCSNSIECDYVNCFNPEEMFKASSIVKFDGRLKICHPLKNVDARTFADGLTNVSELIITSNCECGYDPACYKEMLTQNQMELLCETFEQRSEPLESLELNGLSMINMDQDRLINCLFKVKRLLLGGGHDSQPLLRGKSFINLILQNMPNIHENMSNFKISELYLEKLEVPSVSGNSHKDMADALCQIETIYLGRGFSLPLVTIKRVIRKIRTKRIKMENLFILGVMLWNNHFSPRHLKRALTKLKRFAFFGKFSPEQLEAVRSIAGAVVEPIVILDEDGEVFDPAEQNWIIKKGFEN